MRSLRNWTIVGVISIHFRSRYRLGIFLGLQNFNFFCISDTPDIIWGLSLDAGPTPTYEEKLKVPPPLFNWDSLF